MRIGIYAPFSLENRGGNENRVIMQAKGLIANGFKDFKLFSFAPNRELGDIEQEVVGKNFILKNFPLGQKLGKLDADIVHTHHYYGAMVLDQPFILDMPSFKSLETDYVHRMSGSSARRFVMRRIFNPFFQKPLEKKMVYRAKKVIVCCKEIRDNIFRQYGRKGLDIEIIYHGIEVGDFKPTECEDFVVGVIASSYILTNHTPALSVVKDIVSSTNFRFRIAGKMSKGQKESFSGLENVECLGYLPGSKFKEYLNSISVVLVPYPEEFVYGGTRFDLLEAAASSIPIVATPAGAVGFDFKEAVLIGSGTKELISRLGELKDKNYRKDKGALIGDIVRKEFDYVKMGRKLAELYNELRGF